MKESEEQKQLIQWARSRPWGFMLFHICNENVGGYAWAVRNRQMGVRKGVPDLMLPIPMNGFHGLFIELKTDKGRLSEAQKVWIENLRSLGYRVEVCKGFVEAKDVLKEYMGCGS